MVSGAIPGLDATALKTVALVLSLGLDTFAVAVGLGLSRLARADTVRYGLAFATAEGVMPLVGFGAGQVVSGAIAGVAPYAAIGLLFAVGLYTLWESREGEEREYGTAGVLSLVAVALSVSLDELAIGLSLGLLQVPVALTVALIAAQAFVVTMAGTAIGGMLGRRVQSGSEALAGLVLTVLAAGLLIERIAA